MDLERPKLLTVKAICLFKLDKEIKLNKIEFKFKTPSSSSTCPDMYTDPTNASLYYVSNVNTITPTGSSYKARTFSIVDSSSLQTFGTSKIMWIKNKGSKINESGCSDMVRAL